VVHMFIPTRTGQYYSGGGCLRNQSLCIGVPICGVNVKTSVFSYCLNCHCYDQYRKEVAGGRCRHFQTA
jgi:hypothetical protein